MRPSRKLCRLTVAIIAALTLGACAPLSIQGNAAATQDFSQKQLGTQLRWLNSEQARQQAQDEVDALLAKPLSQEDASRLALAYSPAFQALLADNASSSAQLTQSARWANPVFSFEKLLRMEDGERDLDIGRKLVFSIVDLFTLPQRMARATLGQERLRWQSASDAVGQISSARQAWISAVAAQQSLAYYGDVMEAAEAAAELARRMQAAGNFSRLQRLRQQALYAEAAAQLERASVASGQAREALIRSLGLSSAQAARLQLPSRLPNLPTQPRDEQSVLQQSLDERLDMRLARLDLDLMAKDMGLSRVTSLLPSVHISAINNSASNKKQQRGYELEFPIPLFDWGDARRADAQSRYMAAVFRAQQGAIDASSFVRQHYQAYVSSWQLARHYREEVMPLRKTISEETVLKYNGMLIGVFDLLADARSQSMSVVATIEAERDFWLADANLQASLLGRSAAGQGSGVSMQGMAGDAGGGH